MRDKCFGPKQVFHLRWPTRIVNKVVPIACLHRDKQGVEGHLTIVNIIGFCIDKLKLLLHHERAWEQKYTCSPSLR